MSRCAVCALEMSTSRAHRSNAEPGEPFTAHSQPIHKCDMNSSSTAVSMKRPQRAMWSRWRAARGAPPKRRRRRLPRGGGHAALAGLASVWFFFELRSLCYYLPRGSAAATYLPRDRPAAVLPQATYLLELPHFYTPTFFGRTGRLRCFPHVSRATYVPRGVGGGTCGQGRRGLYSPGSQGRGACVWRDALF